jgi:hypothetical protein
MVDFSPSKEKKVRNAVAVHDIKVLQKRVRHWRMVSLVIAVALIALYVITGIAWQMLAAHPLEIAGLEMESVDARITESSVNMLPEPAWVTAGSSYRFVGWDMRLGNNPKHSINVVSLNDSPAFALTSSDAKSEIELMSPVIQVEQGMKLTLESAFLKEPDFEGSIVVFASLTKRDSNNGTIEEVHNYIVKEPTLERKGGWRLAKQTFTLPANAESIRIGIRGKFEGTVSARNLSLIRSD